MSASDKLAHARVQNVNDALLIDPRIVSDNKVSFKFVRATNLKSEKDPHMHEVTYTFVDADTLKAEWTLYQDGKPGGQFAFELKRKK